MIPRSFSLLFLTAALSTSCCLAQVQDRDQHQLQEEPTLASGGFVEENPKLQEVEVLDIASEGEITNTTPPVYLPLNRSLKLNVYHTVHHGYNSLYGYVPVLSNEQVEFDFNKESILGSTVVTANNEYKWLNTPLGGDFCITGVVIFSPKAKGTTILEYSYTKTIPGKDSLPPKTCKTTVYIPLIVEDPVSSVEQTL
jgi:hypothetical protein